MNAQEAAEKTHAIRMLKAKHDIKQFIKDWKLVIASAIGDGKYHIELEVPHVDVGERNSREHCREKLNFLVADHNYRLKFNHGAGKLFIRVEWNYIV